MAACQWPRAKLVHPVLAPGPAMEHAPTESRVPLVVSWNQIIVAILGHPSSNSIECRSRPALSGPVSMADSSTDQQRRNVMNSFAATDTDEAPVWKVESQSSIYQPRYSGFRVVQNDVFVDSGTSRRYWRQWFEEL